MRSREVFSLRVSEQNLMPQLEFVPLTQTIGMLGEPLQKPKKQVRITYHDSKKAVLVGLIAWDEFLEVTDALRREFASLVNGA